MIVHVVTELVTINGKPYRRIDSVWSDRDVASSRAIELGSGSGRDAFEVDAGPKQRPFSTKVERMRCAHVTDGPIAHGTKNAPVWRKRCKNKAQLGGAYCHVHRREH